VNWFSGNAKTSIVACIAPTALNSEESFSTLHFASRAMTVKINPKLNENVYLKVVILNFLFDEVFRQGIIPQQ